MIAQTTELIVAMNKMQLQSAIQAFQIGYGAWESLLKLNTEASRSLVQEGAASLQSVAAVRDAAGVSSWSGTQFRAGVEKCSGYSRNVYDIVAQTSGNFGTLVEQTLLSTSEQYGEWVDEVLKGSFIPQPQGTATAARAAMENTRTVIEGISKAVRQTAEYADASVRAAATATAEAVKGKV